MQIPAALILMAGVVSTAFAQTYPIQMNRPVRAGQTYHFSATGSTRRLMAAGDRTLAAEEYEVKFEGRAKVEAVDKAKQPYQISFTVETFTETKAGTTVDLLRPGTVIFADGSRKKQYSLQSGEMDKASEQAFGLIYSSQQPDSTLDNDIFGSKQPRSVGESWPINAKLFAENMRKETPMTVAPDQLSGTTQFVSLDQVAGTRCANLKARITGDNLSGSDSDAGFSISRGSLQATFGGCFPVNELAQSFKSMADYSLHFQASVANGQRLDGTYESKSEAIWLATETTP